MQEEINWVGLIIGVIIAGLFIGSIVWIMLIQPEEDRINKVDCYDKESNKIIGMECEEVVYGISKTIKIIILITSIILYLLIVYLIYIQSKVQMYL